MLIKVSNPHIPSNKNFNKYLDIAIHAKQLTNFGKLERIFREKLSSYFGLNDIVLTCNATIGLELAIAAMLKPEDQHVYTTPYTFKATSSAIKRNGIPVRYVDIEKNSIQSSYRDYIGNQNMFLDTHVYGVPSTLIEENIDNERVIFDAAHAFDVFLNGEHIVKKGNISVISLHATKTMHSIEGGIIASKDTSLLSEIRDRTNFALKSDDDKQCGNYKFSEIHAAFGLANFDEIDRIFLERTKLIEMYNEILSQTDKKTVEVIKTPSVSYYPIKFRSRQLAELFSINMKQVGIEVRPYFDRSLDTIYGGEQCQNSRELSGRVICLPMGSQFTEHELSHLKSKLIEFFENDIYKSTVFFS